MARQTTLARFDVSGEILSEDTLALLAAKNCKIAGAESDAMEFAAAWELLTEQWQLIRTEVADFDTQRLRSRWIIHLLELLGHDPQFLKNHVTYAEDRKIPLTHRSRNVPMWLLGYNEDPDEKPAAGRRRSPHELFQEYLDLTEDDWGIICNGKTIRLLHDYHKTLTRNYVEADLESIFESLDVDAFRAVWRVFNARQFQPDGKGVLPIEKLRDYSRQEGAEIGKELRKQVLAAITTLGNGFLAADRSGTLREALAADVEGPLLFYQSLLRIVYRLLFLLYIENKPHWTPASDPIWASSYSITRLRELAEDQSATRASGVDYWEGLKVVFGIIRNGNERFRIHPYGGELFNDARLWQIGGTPLRNADLLHALRLLTVFERNKQAYRVNFRTLRIDALGSVYEALLDVAPVVTLDGVFTFAEGTERKLTGSYYTPPELVAELIKSALVPVIENRLSGVQGREAREAALLAIQVVDPACGSGAFLIQALDKLTEVLCDIRKEGEEPSELDIRQARRDVVTHCIHGVDLNPMAVELCKFTLWLHVAHPKLPLSYLEPLIKCGNALVGVPLYRQIERSKSKIEAERRLLLECGDRLAATKLQYIGWPDSVPDEAFDAVAGDDRNFAKSARTRNKQQREGQSTLEAELIRVTVAYLAEAYEKVKEVGEDHVEAVRAKDARYRAYQASQEYSETKLLYDLWCATFYWRLESSDNEVPTHQWLMRAQAHPDELPITIPSELERITTHIRPFHWEIEFPDVFNEKNGFDCVLGNPPWERIKLEEKEFFASRDSAIASAQNKQVRQNMISSLENHNPLLLRAFDEAKHSADCDSKFIRNSGRFPLSSTGDINTFPLFTENALNLLNSTGRSGIVVPTAISTSKTNAVLFEFISSSSRLVSLFDFQEARDWFHGLESRDPFCLLTMSGESVTSETPSFVFRAIKIDEFQTPIRQIDLGLIDFSFFNPNTHTCPVFRTKLDYILAKDIYSRLPIFHNLEQNSAPWNTHFSTPFHMTKDSKEGFFRSEPMSGYVPLYESKMLHQFDHRFGSYEGRGETRGFSSLPDTQLEQYRDANYQVKPFYWVDTKEVISRLPKTWTFDWLIAFRNSARGNDARTFISTILPKVGVGNNAPLLLPRVNDPRLCSALLANLNSVIFDYVMRQKVGGSAANFFIVEQLAVLPPQAYHVRDIDFIGSRVLELVYTEWALQPFALDMGYNGTPFVWDEDHRAFLRAELDAYYARLYGLTRRQLRYILDPHGLSDEELQYILDPWEDPTCNGPHLLPAQPTTTFPGETFRVLKNNETAKYGDYRTRRLVLEAWARLEEELGPAQPVNYHEMLNSNSSPPPEVGGAKTRTVNGKVSDREFELVPPDWSPQERMKL